MGEKVAPTPQLRLEWVYGYRGHQCRNNLFVTRSKELVYFVAGVGIVYNDNDGRQRFFLGHDDDILCLCLHPDRVLTATGQTGKNPYICVWDSSTMEMVSVLKDGHQNGVGAVNFDKDGSRLVSVGLDQHATINVWDWRKGRIIATVRGHSDRVFDVQFHPHQPNMIVSCGVKHIKFWTLCGNALTAQKGVFGKAGEIQTMLCLAFGRDNTTYAGTMAGDVYIWKGNNLDRVVQAVHNGAIYTMDQTDDCCYATGSKDGTAKLWDTDFKPITTINLVTAKEGYKGLCVRSVCWQGDSVYMGTQDSEIFEVGVRDREAPKCLVQGHAEGELWALAVHPTKPVFATGSDDQTLRIWNMNSFEILSKTSLDQKIRSCSFDNDGGQLAVGLMDGSFMVLKSRDLSEVIHIKDRKEVIHEMKFSPCGKFLAVGSNDNFVDVYSKEQRYKHVGTCSGSSSFITHIDWSNDSKHLQTNSGAAERLVFKMPTGKQLTNKEELSSIHWASFTGVLGQEVNGIWEKYTDTNDVNAVDANFDGGVIVTGDDFGLVKLFKFPSLKKGAKFRKYLGHSAHVTNVRFSCDKRRIITTGGGDHAVFQWKYLQDGKSEDLDPQRGFIDSNSEESDSDLSDVGQLDSDLEKEKQASYERSLYQADTANVKKLMKQELGAGQKRKSGPVDSLKLEFIHGYRGYDCRNNLFYTQSGEIVYHVAAAGILYNKTKNTQRFYLGHTDDILCLCIHPLKDLIATGQVGRQPSVHVWDTETMTAVSVLKGHHERGICAVDFSADGRKLASIGLDDNHTIVVWDWKKGEKLAATRGHKDKTFVVRWNLFDNNKLITVGVKHIKFWTQTGGGFTSSRGTFGNIAKNCDMLCLAFGKAEDIVYSGGADGSVYVWAGNKLQKTTKAHEGPLLAMHSLDKGFVTGGKDGVIGLWDDQFERCLKTYTLKQANLSSVSNGLLIKDSPAVRAVVLGHGKILVGTRNGEILEVDKGGPITLLTQGHCDGELWGLAMHGTKDFCVTVSDDKTLRVWDLSDAHKMVNHTVLPQAARCVDFSPDGKFLAVGYRDGSFSVLNTGNMQVVISFHHRKEEIADIKFSPDPGKYLAVASHDNIIDIYNVLGQKRVGTCKGASSYITHVDWDKQGKVLMVNSGAKEQLFFEAPRGKRITLKNEEIERFNWNSWTSVLGITCEGLWPPKCDVTDINATCMSSDRRVIATADDFGFVKLFNYPAKGQFAKYKKYAGHSAHVTNIRFSTGDKKLVTTGGADTAVMVWSHISPETRATGCGDSDDSDTDSEEEGGYDSDVEREKNMDYSQKIYVNPIRDKEGVKPHLQERAEVQKPGVSRNAPQPPKVKKADVPPSAGGKRKKSTQVTELQLEYIHGYRGFDSRNNLHYVNDGADIVFHAAGAGIIKNLSSGNQSFYLEHTDDILCLAVNQHPKFKNVVATGQIGNPSSVHIWNTTSKETLSILRGAHSSGVCSVDFSCTGKYIVTVGLQHTITVWRWQEGAKLASTQGHNQRIFRAEFRPDSDSQFVSVGVKHVKFWTLAGSELVGKRGLLTDAGLGGDIQKQQTMLSIGFGANNVTYTGAMSGDVYVWQDTRLTRLVQKAHQGPVFSMFTTLRDGLIVTGGKDMPSKENGPIKLWDQEMKRCRAFPIRDHGSKPDVVKSVFRIKGRLLVGTRDNDILEISEKTGTVQVLVGGHGEGELWGLDSHPTLPRFITASYDGTLRIWDIPSKALLSKLNVGSARSASFSWDGEMIAVGLQNGEFLILLTNGLKMWGKRRDRAGAINSMRFSPNGKYLAVGSEDSCVDFYDISRGPTLHRLGYCKDIPSPVIQLDFSADGDHIRVSTCAYIHQVFAVPSGTPVQDAAVINKITWATWTSVLGDEVVGIWPKDASQADVNCSHLSHMGTALATGDDSGFVKLFDFPCSEKYAAHKFYVGHSAHVTNVRFTHDDRFLISTGGDDCCVFVWKCI